MVKLVALMPGVVLGGVAMVVGSSLAIYYESSNAMYGIDFGYFPLMSF